MHTIVVASGVDSDFRVDDPTAVGLLVDRDFEGNIFGVEPMTSHLRYQNRIKMYSAEAQQIVQTFRHTTIMGLRFHDGEFHTRNLQTDPSVNVGQWFNGPPANQEFTTDFQRFSAYAYHHWSLLDSLLLIGGIAYDRLDFPENFRAPPVTGEQESMDQVSPKAGLVWTPLAGTILRGAYTRSLGGASLDQSLTIEPTQVAGLNQSFRSLRPESLGGSEAGTEFETMALSVEQRFKSNTYLTISAELLESERDGVLGVFDKDFFGVALPNTTPRLLDYEEQSLGVSVDQLIARDFAVGARYRLTRAEIEESFPEVQPFDPTFLLGGFKAETELRATLHQVELHAIYNHPLGFFGKAQTIWNSQSNAGYEPSLEGDEFWHFNLYAGYRFLQRRGEITVGLLNIADQDYRLNPLTLYNEFPRERTFYCRLRLRF
jgi:outer membrane receptor protein involved in Fe transport